MVRHVTAPTAALLDDLPSWATLVRAPNPGPMTLDGTNTWVLRAPGAPACLVVDPGPLDDGHLAAINGHAPIAAIAVTHHHIDHTEAVPRLVDLSGAPVVADITEVAGLRVDVGRIPGHTADSVYFRVSYPDGGEPAVLTGDTILGRGTAVVAWPDGNLADYLDSLRRLETLGRIPLLPGHGPSLADCAAAATFYREHREARLEQVRDALRSGDSTAAEVVARVYADVDRVLWPFAEKSVEAQLEFLRRESHRPPEELDEP